VATGDGDETAWDVEQTNAYSKAFDDTIGLWRPKLERIGLIPRVMTAREFLTVVDAPSYHDPGLVLREIEPVSLRQKTLSTTNSKSTSATQTVIVPADMPVFGSGDLNE
jgi:hypothetical protein